MPTLESPNVKNLTYLHCDREQLQRQQLREQLKRQQLPVTTLQQLRSYNSNSSIATTPTAQLPLQQLCSYNSQQLRSYNSNSSVATTPTAL